MNTTSFPNRMLQDNSISFRARGMLAMILTSGDNDEIRREWLEEQCTEGKAAVASAMRELERAGYAVMVQIRDNRNRYIKSVWTFYDEPVEESLRSNVTRWSK